MKCVYIVAFIWGVFSAAPASCKFYSQFQQDNFIFEKIFKDKKNGVFLDIGAHDGVSFSNTKFFEESLGWTGICVEPIPEIFDQLIKNRKAICIRGCISDHKGTDLFLKVESDTKGLEMLSGLFNKYDPRHLERVKRDVNSYQGTVTLVEVDCYLLNEVLQNAKISHIDYLTIDTEGGELDLLKSIDFSQITIDVIDVENNYEDPDFCEFLSSKGYRFITHLGTDDIYEKIK